MFSNVYLKIFVLPFRNTQNIKFHVLYAFIRGFHFIYVHCFNHFAPHSIFNKQLCNSIKISRIVLIYL